MTFVWEISLGNLLTVIGFAGSGVIFVMMMRADMMVLGNRVLNVEAALRELVKVNVTLAHQEGMLTSMNERLNAISTRIDAVAKSQMARH